ncbi:hypothetical protein FNV43_RR19700 [Rhamnella rubrinervis]|uniref:Disease resistance RPP13-like protein 1 n=1 Tax=Rhamnella rubrinervis TaxID=2594499 RepID=A0A8K0GPS0_9ROSA|nr:hypothetical protein FNV43_RR19700 [Rhamnella rubrinervis]
MAAEVVGGALLSASLQVLFERMASREVLDFIRGEKLNHGLLKKLKIKLLSANAVVSDAEEKQICRPAVRDWLVNMEVAQVIGGGKIYVIPIVGMGGIGETTLAQIIYKDIDGREMKKPFDFKLWVSVSNEFDVFRKTEQIAERVTSQTFSVKDLVLLQVKLEETLKGKKFFACSR